jgi:glutamyl-Q tRNA(Asp) synthetase
VAALASWLDARARGGRWLLRIEDVDTPRCVPGADEVILQQLAACGLQPDEAPVWQSRRGGLYADALQQLRAQGMAYDCACTRQDIAAALAAAGAGKQRFGELVYPGTCRPQNGGLRGRAPRAVRFLTQDAPDRPALVHWTDRRLGAQQQDVAQAVGDFVLQRADGLWAYQLAVVVDDAAQGITHVVRGEDLADNTARQILLQRALGLPTAAYLHTPLVCGADGAKLSKQNGAQALALPDSAAALVALRRAAAVLGLPELLAQTLSDWLAAAVPAWAGMMPTLSSSSMKANA